MSSCFMYKDIKWERYWIDQCRTDQNIESTSTSSIHSSSLVINRYQKYMGDIIIGNKQISEVYGRNYNLKQFSKYVNLKFYKNVCTCPWQHLTTQKLCVHTNEWCLVQSSLSVLEQYIGLCPIVIIHGLWARFSGLLASYREVRNNLVNMHVEKTKHTSEL